jgi:stage V sporulation protein B
MSKFKQSFIKGAIIISLGGFISKVLGAIYRIPLCAILGSEGIGIYQMVYPLYCILLTISASGIPTGIARLISSGKGCGAERSAFVLYGLIGLVGSAIMYLLSRPLAIIQGESGLELCCKLLSPSVFFVSILSIVRGYFQGKGNMYPTAVSEVLEQVVKVAFGCSLAYMFRANLYLATSMTLLSVTISEFIALMVTYIWYLKRRERQPLYKVIPVPYSSILAFTIPLTLTAAALPLSQFFESIVAVRLLKQICDNAVSLYGVYSGCALTIVNLPVSVTYGLAAAVVPEISPLASSGNISGAKKKAYKAIFITLLISIPLSIALYIFAPLASKIIFRSLTVSEGELLITLVRIMAVNAVTLSLVQTSSACLTSLGKPVAGTIFQWISCGVRVALCAVLIKYTHLSIVGVAISANCCYLLATIFNLCYIISIKKQRFERQ